MVNFLILNFVFGLSFSVPAFAVTDFSSVNFNNSAPVITLLGGHSSSSNFQLISSLGQAVIGQSTSSNFSYYAGFLYFPLISSPSISGTAGDAVASLSWSAAEAELGYTISGYQVGQSLSIAGPFAYSNVGNVLTSSRTGLTNGATYYFMVRALDAFGSSISSSSILAVIPAGATTTATTTPGGSGGGGGGGVQTGTIIFNGYSIPEEFVVLLKDGQIVSKVKTNSDGSFTINLETAPGAYHFNLYAETKNEERSALFSGNNIVVAGQTTASAGILLAPIVSIDKLEVKQGNRIIVSGRSVPGAIIEIDISKGVDKYISAIAGKNGDFRVSVDSSLFGKGIYSVKARVVFKGSSGVWSRTFTFTIGVKNIPVKGSQKYGLKADISNDGHVDLIDFSILIYWFNKRPSDFKADLNEDGAVDLSDFSIMMYYWTG